MTVPRRSPSALFLLGLLGLDLIVMVGVVGLPGSTGGLSGYVSRAAGASAPAGAMDRNWAYCQTTLLDKPVTPTSVTITYLEAELDTGVTAQEIRGWLGTIDPLAVDVYRLVHKDGKRRVALELSQAKWPRWDEVAGGQSGEAACSLVRAALLAAGVGRPEPPDDDGQADPARHRFEFVYARRPWIYASVEWMGTLAHVLEADGLAQLQGWLNGEES